MYANLPMQTGMHSYSQKEMLSIPENLREKTTADICTSTVQSVSAIYKTPPVSATITYNRHICKLIWLSSIQSLSKLWLQKLPADTAEVTLKLLKDRNRKLPVHILQHFFLAG